MTDSAAAQRLLQRIEHRMQFDCVAILTNHSALDVESMASHASLVIDTRNAPGPRDGVFRLGAPAPQGRADVDLQTVPPICV